MLSAGNAASPCLFVGGREGARESEQAFTVKPRILGFQIQEWRTITIIHWCTGQVTRLALQLGPTVEMRVSSYWGRFERLLSCHGRDATASEVG